jgi:hypothetical protein
MIHFKSPIIKLIIKIAIFLAVLASLDFICGGILEKLYFNQKTGLFYRTTYGLEKTNAEVLIFGSSSANHHYNPVVLEKQLNLTVYNEGRDGMDILYHTAILKGILKRYAPKVIVLNIAPNELTTSNGYDRFSILLPYLRKYPEMIDVLRLKSKYEKIKCISKTYSYNSMLLTIITGMMPNKEKAFIDKGFVPLFDTLNISKTKISILVNDPKLDSNRVNFLNQFIKISKERGIKLYVVFSPYYSSDINTTCSIEAVNSICKQYKIPIINYIQDSSFTKREEYFVDGGHLNINGANLLSTKLSTIINKDLLDCKLEVLTTDK